MEILLGKRKHDRDFRPLLSDPQEVEELLRKIKEPWIDWFDFSVAERFNDDPSISDLIGQHEGAVIWKLRTTDGVDAYIFIALDIEHGVIHLDYKIQEPEGLTLLRCFRPILERKFAEFGMDLPEARSIKEYRDLLEKKVEETPPNDSG